jgi:hypothetical protein
MGRVSARGAGVFGLGMFAGVALSAGGLWVGSRVAFERGLYEPCRVGQVWTVEEGCVNAAPTGPTGGS